MRLLHVQTFELYTFYEDDIPPYAILSHTWYRDKEEVSFAQIKDPGECLSIPGFRKIQYLCQQAIVDGLRWAWIDTCCIDKTNSTELSEAINSMFHWYNQSQLCYVYLSDFGELTGDDMDSSRWWNRAWTLQELLAPRQVIFYDMTWSLIGTKATLTEMISLFTGIDEEVLTNPGEMYNRSVAQRMSWAAHRVATRVEDVAYSLLGIFAVTMSMKYGEGKQAFMRLQKKIVKRSNDQSLFAWGFQPHMVTKIPDTMYITQDSNSWAKGPFWNTEGIFAESPKFFSDCRDIIFHNQHALDHTFGESNGTMAITMPLLSISHQPPLRSNWIRRTFRVALLPCGFTPQPNLMVGFLLEEWTPGRFRRVRHDNGVFTFLVDCHIVSEMETARVWVDNLSWIVRHNSAQRGVNDFHKSLRIDFQLPANEYSFKFVPARDWIYNDLTETLQLHHSMDSENKRLYIRINRHKAENFLIVGVSLENTSDDSYLRPLLRQGNNVSIHKGEGSIEEDCITDYGFQNRRERLEETFEDIHVKLKTRKMFNHLVSVLTIGNSISYV